MRGFAYIGRSRPRAVFEKGQLAEPLPTPHRGEDRLFLHRHNVHCLHLDEEQRISDPPPLYRRYYPKYKTRNPHRIIVLI